MEYFFAIFRDNLKFHWRILRFYSFAKIDPFLRIEFLSFPFKCFRRMMLCIMYEENILEFSSYHFVKSILKRCFYEAMSSHILQFDQQKDYLLYRMLKLGRRFDCCVWVLDFL